MVAERDGNSFYDEFSTGTYLGMANGGWKPDCLLFMLRHRLVNSNTWPVKGMPRENDK